MGKPSEKRANLLSISSQFSLFDMVYLLVSEKDKRSSFIDVWTFLEPILIVYVYIFLFSFTKLLQYFP